MQGLEIKVNFLLLIFHRNPFYVCNLKKTLHDRPVKIVAKMFQLSFAKFFSYCNFYRHATKADFSLQLIEVELSNFEFIEQRIIVFGSMSLKFKVVGWQKKEMTIPQKSLKQI